MAQGKKATGPGGLSVESILVFIGIGLFVVVVGGIWSSLKIAAAINDTIPVRGNPVGAITDLLNGRLSGPAPRPAYCCWSS